MIVMPTMYSSPSPHTAHVEEHTNALMQEYPPLATASPVRHRTVSSVTSVADISRTPTKRLRSPLLGPPSPVTDLVLSRGHRNLVLGRQSLQAAATISLQRNTPCQKPSADPDLSIRQPRAHGARFHHAELSVWYDVPPTESPKQVLDFSPTYPGICEMPVGEATANLTRSRIFVNINQAPVEISNSIEEVHDTQDCKSTRHEDEKVSLASVVISSNGTGESGELSILPTSNDHVRSSRSTKTAPYSCESVDPFLNLSSDAEEPVQHSGQENHTMPRPDFYSFQDALNSHGPITSTPVLTTAPIASTQVDEITSLSMTKPVDHLSSALRLEHDNSVVRQPRSHPSNEQLGRRVLLSECAVSVRDSEARRVHVKAYPVAPDSTPTDVNGEVVGTQASVERLRELKTDEIYKMGSILDSSGDDAPATNTSSSAPASVGVRNTDSERSHSRAADAQYIEDTHLILSRLFLFGKYTGEDSHIDHSQNVAAWNDITGAYADPIRPRLKRRTKSRKRQAKLRSHRAELSAPVEHQTLGALPKTETDIELSAQYDHQHSSQELVKDAYSATADSTAGVEVEAQVNITQKLAFATPHPAPKCKVRPDFTNLTSLTTRSISTHRLHPDTTSTQPKIDEISGSSPGTTSPAIPSTPKPKSAMTSKKRPSISSTKSVRFLDQVEIRTTDTLPLPNSKKSSRRKRRPQGPLQSILNKPAAAGSKLECHDESVFGDVENQGPDS